MDRVMFKLEKLVNDIHADLPSCHGFIFLGRRIKRPPISPCISKLTTAVIKRIILVITKPCRRGSETDL
jgi:hypothetical protein